MNSESSEPSPLKPEKVQQIYDQFAVALNRFLLGVLRNESSAADALQITFTKLMEKGHLVQQQDSMKSWLFRVAFNEAMLIKRRASINQKHTQGIAWVSELSSGAEKGADDRLSQSLYFAIQKEEGDLVQQALGQLPERQRQVVELRMYENLKFREIAEKLNVPLGTVLARMQAALKKLKPILEQSIKEFD